MFRKVCDSHCAAAAQARGDQPGAPEDVQPYRARGVGGKHSFTHFLLYLRCAFMMQTRSFSEKKFGCDDYFDVNKCLQQIEMHYPHVRIVKRATI